MTELTNFSHRFRRWKIQYQGEGRMIFAEALLLVCRWQPSCLYPHRAEGGSCNISSSSCKDINPILRTDSMCLNSNKPLYNIIKTLGKILKHLVSKNYFYYVQSSSVTQSCPTLCDPKDGSPPGSPVPGILQARILEWVAISSSRGSSRSRGKTHISCIGRRILYH